MWVSRDENSETVFIWQTVEPSSHYSPGGIRFLPKTDEDKRQPDRWLKSVSDGHKKHLGFSTGDEAQDNLPPELPVARPNRSDRYNVSDMARYAERRRRKPREGNP